LALSHLREIPTHYLGEVTILLYKECVLFKL
jgi:hypothetical protein